jgi:hypothetical protein
MPQFAPVVLSDRATTPVDHTFQPRGVNGGVATLVESVSGVPLADRRITLSTNRPNGTNRVKVIIKIALPVVQDVEVAGVTRPTIVRTNYADLTFNFDAGSTLRERDDLVGFIEGLTKWTDNDDMLAVLVELEGLW